jgi:hypothetical protein
MFGPELIARCQHFKFAKIDAKQLVKGIEYLDLSVGSSSIRFAIGTG